MIFGDSHKNNKNVNISTFIESLRSYHVVIMLLWKSRLIINQQATKAANEFRNWSPTRISIDRSGKRERLAPRVCPVKIPAAQTRRRIGGVDDGGINADVTMPPPSVIDRVARWRRHAHRQGRRYFGRHAPPSLTPSTSLPLRWRWWSRPQWRSNLPPPRGLRQFALGVTCLRTRFRVSGIFRLCRRVWYTDTLLFRDARCFDRLWRGEPGAKSRRSIIQTLLPVRKFHCCCLRLHSLVFKTNLPLFFSSCWDKREFIEGLRTCFVIVVIISTSITINKEALALSKLLKIFVLLILIMQFINIY